ncbi:MAG: hypothetical protein V4864_25400 [Pseudomonadota bacterium]
MPELSVIRRFNLEALRREFQTEQIAGGAKAFGLEAAFARKLEVSPAQLSQMRKSASIGEKLARQIEHHCGKPKDWLDGDHGNAAVPTPAEEHFVSLARAAWRAANAKRKRELRKLMEAETSC